ncbi:Metallo-hydrolase/oxidoreductase [Tilletiaria anomala UBC 951]|uniref:Metallo-hydrolase/oxidoreductase n=1 Tax=Tilletiaria anomala (strain ATCC 24038 / CBS 436.72 / UBC 951) TaxID=1037660 RepID=A0A066WHI2_TILAU|nr:Metallo-hydrolase/oxidoreductase [Tilletiaria anomala UBC 951]KDN53447.1 Metallo-hydrolase/oxidoreductase [Tilletiaria anomala UBC 951]
MALIKVQQNSRDAESIAPAFCRRSPPPHHQGADPTKAGFKSPWASARQLGLFSFLRTRLFDWNEKPLPPKEQLPAVRIVTFEATSGDASDIRFTWLGHASCHLQIPVLSGGTFTIITDPVLSRRCSPFSFAGPKRYTDACTTVDAIASSSAPGAWPDAIAISHNHYDHLDLATIKALISRPNGKPVPHIFCTLGVKAWFLSLGLSPDHVTELDWWDRRVVQRESDGARVRFTCTPAQHFSGRGLICDKTLWGGWALEILSQEEAKRGAKIWFAGDTGYRHVPRKGMSREEEDQIPSCPAFRELGDMMGPFDLALIPIGAYLPRVFMSNVHCSPSDAVRIHREVHSRKSFGIHWGVFRLTPEAPDEPPRLLKEEAALLGLPEDQFAVCEIGETVNVVVE